MQVADDEQNCGDVNCIKRLQKPLFLGNVFMFSKCKVRRRGSQEKLDEEKSP